MFLRFSGLGTSHSRRATAGFRLLSKHNMTAKCLTCIYMYSITHPTHIQVSTYILYREVTKHAYIATHKIACALLLSNEQQLFLFPYVIFFTAGSHLVVGIAYRVQCSAASFFVSCLLAVLKRITVKNVSRRETERANTQRNRTDGTKGKKKKTLRRAHLSIDSSSSKQEQEEDL